MIKLSNCMNMKIGLLFAFVILFLISCQEDPEVRELDEDTIEEIEDSDDMRLPIELFLSGDYTCDIKSVDVESWGYTIHFDGTECPNSVKLFGEVQITRVNDKPWEDAGAIYEIKYFNFESRKDNQMTDSLKKVVMKTTINGTETMINVSGGEIGEFLNGTTTTRLIRKLKAKNLSIEFNGNFRGTRYVNRLQTKEYIKNQDEVTQVSYGDTLIHSIPNVMEWGINSYDAEFFTEIDEPIVKTFCGERWKITAGKKIRHSQRSPRTNTYGVTKEGLTDNSCNAYGFLVSWVNNKGEAKQKIYKY